MNMGNKRSVSVDDLLRLKRTERPAQDFWAEFDRQLRAKQLAALVEKRPWWRTAPSLAALWPRVRIPLGVATVVGIGFFSARSYRDPGLVPASASPEATFASAAAVAPTISPSTVDMAAASAPAAAAVASLIAEPASLVAEQVSPAAADIVTQAVVPAAAVAEVETSLPTALDRALVMPSLALNSPAENRGALSVSRPRVDPLQQMTPPGESRRGRYLTAMVSSATVGSSARISERAANRFAEDRLQDAAGRFGARGDRVHVKF